ncbi:MAG: hypothetical protein AB7K24_29125 [Gemmataceae bacterium]
MNDQPCHHPCLLFALKREAAPFLRGVRPVAALAGGPCPAFLCGPPERQVVVLETGVGARAVLACFDWLLAKPRVQGAEYRPGLILSAGFSGALTEKLQVGDVVQASGVVDGSGKEWPITWPVREGAGPLITGRLFCSDRFIGDTGAKLALGHARRAVAVDMESAVIARLCHEQQLPFGCLRVISDDVRVPLHAAIFELIEGESVSYRRLAWLLLRSPWMSGQLVRLARQTSLAALRLAEATQRLLDSEYFTKKK